MTKIDWAIQHLKDARKQLILIDDEQWKFIIDAVELQRPKRPNKKQEEYWGTWFECPNCECEIKFERRMCPDCGQIIDWEFPEED